MEDALIEEIKRLRRKLGARRYKLADVAIDNVYKIARKLRPARVSDAPMADVKYDTKRRFKKGAVDIINYQFYDWESKNVYLGGAERYVVDLAKLLARLGYKVRILQGAERDFRKRFQGFSVIGIKMQSRDRQDVSRVLAKACQEAEFVISSPDELAVGLESIPCIAINHGINFDDSSRRELKGCPEQNLENPYRYILGGLRGAKKCVCVDTNFMNWVRTRDADLGKKLVFIPNYYDGKVFKPVKKYHGKKVVFVFPRRIEECRGSIILREAFCNVVKKYPNVELRLAGQVQNEDAQKDVNWLLEYFPKNVSHCQYDMDDVYAAYQGADVVLVPSCWSEGTSLSCLEGQASGLPVIATNVGGLSNLVIDHYNGLLISPTAQDLEKAMIEMIEKPEARREMGKKAIEVAKCFEKNVWERRWEEMIKSFAEEANKNE